MKKRNLIIVICLFVLLACVGGFLLGRHLLDSKNTTKPQAETNDVSHPAEPDVSEKDENKPAEEEIVPPSEDVSSKVDIPVANETIGLQFPCEVPGHNLRIEKLAPYTGIFVEDGTNQQVTGVAMIMVQNTGDDVVEYAEITVEYANKTLCFQITALPAGERMVVQEKTGSGVPEGAAGAASALVVHRTQMKIASEISVSDNGDNSLIVKNMTNETIPTVRIFYKYYMENENMFVGGIAFTVRITSLGSDSSMVVYPSHYNSQTSRVVMATIYEE